MVKLLTQPIEMSLEIKFFLIVLLLIFFSIVSQKHCYAVTVGDSYGGGTVFCVSQTPDITHCATVGSGDYGLIMANEDQANFYSNDHGVHWSTASVLTGATSLSDGAANTNFIIDAFPHDEPSNNAAWLCHNYKDPMEGHTDWYLPSKDELNKMYIYTSTDDLIGEDCSGSKIGGVQCLVGGSDIRGIYWSSTEFKDCCYDLGANFAWSQRFCVGLYNGVGDCGVRFSDGQRCDGTLCNIDGQHPCAKKINAYYGVRAIRAFKNEELAAAGVAGVVGVVARAEAVGMGHVNWVGLRNRWSGVRILKEE